MPTAPTLFLHDHLDAAQQSSLADIEKQIRNLAVRPAQSIGAGGCGAATGERIIGILESWLLDEEQKQLLTDNPWNIFYLYATARLLERNGCRLPSAGSSNRKTGGAAAPIPDQAHCLRAPAGISENPAAGIIEQICSGYRCADAMEDVIAPAIDSGCGGDVHIQFLAACLRLATALSIDAPTAVEQLRAYLPGAYRENSDVTRHFTLISAGPHPHAQATILVRLQCRNAEVHRALKHYESDLQRLLSALNRIVRPRFLFTAVVFEIEPHGYRPIDFKFSVDTSAALQLFMGNTLYKDRRVFLRELVQNAVDACNLRKLKEDNYTPAIAVAFNSDISRITISDNGIGMSRQWIEKYFLNIGLSFYQSAEIARINRDQNLAFSFISRFGIGFLSSFLVAEKITVKTKKAGSDGLIITISRIDDYFDVREAQEDFPVGTEVTVHLKNSQISYCRSMEYLGYLKTNVRFLPMAVTFVDEKANRSILGQEPMDYSEETLWGTKFTAKLDYKQSQGYLLLRVRENHQYIYDLEPAQGGISVFQDGIFIDQVTHLLPDSAAAYITGRINLVGSEKCELSMDRNHLYWSGDQLAKTKLGILKGVAAIANDLLATVANQTLPDKVHQNLVRKLASFFHFNDVDDTVLDRLHPDIRTLVENKFRLFVRANRFQFDLARHRGSSAESSHGYTHRWQLGMIDRLLHKKTAVERKEQKK